MSATMRTALAVIASLGASLAFVVPPALGAGSGAGNLDPGFGTDGRVVTNQTSGPDSGARVAVQPDGKIVVAGYSGVTRYNPDGTLDAAFGDDGFVPTPLALVQDVALMSDGRIVVALWTDGNLGLDNDLAALRLLPDGSPDPSFGDDGVARRATTGACERGNAVAVTSDGGVLVAGWAHDDSCAFNPAKGGRDFQVVRFTSAGTVDTSYGSGGVVTLDWDDGDDVIYGAALQPDDKLVVAGNTIAPSGDSSDTIVVRLDSDGDLDHDFGSGGTARLDIDGLEVAQAVALRPDGRIMIAGFASISGGTSDNEYGVVSRLTSAGALDPTFATAGTARVHVDDPTQLLDLTLQPDGKTVAVGCVHCFHTDQDEVVVRLAADGALDPGFGQGGSTVTDFPASGQLGSNRAEGVALQPDGRIVATGCRLCLFTSTVDTPLTLTRYLNDATLTVATQGTGSGTVTSDPTGIDCGATCSATFEVDQVTLTAHPSGSSVFAGFSGGGCTGSQPTCQVTLSANTTVTATFEEQVSGLDPTIGGLAQVRQTLTASAGGPLVPADSTLAYQWTADGADIPGATGPTLLLTEDLAGKRIRVRVTASHEGYQPSTVTSPKTPYVREYVKRPRLVLDPATVCPGGDLDVLGQGLQPGTKYELDALGLTFRRTADKYGEVHVSFQVPPDLGWGPHDERSIVLSGRHPRTVSAVLQLDCAD